MAPFRLLRCAATLSLLALTAVALTKAQDSSQSATFRTQSELVLVPVLVQHKSGGHVAGLARDDFELLQEGESQSIALFEEVVTQNASVRRQQRPGEFTNALLGDPGPQRVTVIVLDALHTSFLNQARAREAMVRFLMENLESGETIALLSRTRKGLRILHDFTSDPQPLVDTLRRLKSEMTRTTKEEIRSALDDYQRQRSRTPGARQVGTEYLRMELLAFMHDAEFLSAGYSIQADLLQNLEQIARYISAVPGRKSIIWVGEAFYAMSGPDAARAGRPSLRALYERTFRVLNDANVAVYPVDPAGLEVRLLSASSSGRGDPLGNDIFIPSHGQMDEIANMTGGRAFYNRNDIEKAFAEVSAEARSYYMLGFYLDRSDIKPGWKKLKVKVARKGVRVRARNGFMVAAASDKPLPEQSEMEVALASPLEYSGLPLTVRLSEPLPGEDGSRRVKVAIEIASHGLLPDPSSGEARAEIVAVARRADGEIAARFEGTLQSRIDGSSPALYQDELSLPVGDYQVRVVVSDPISRRIGSVQATLQVSASTAVSTSSN